MKNKTLWPFIVKHKEEPRQHQRAASGRWICPEPLTHGSNPDQTLTTGITHTHIHTYMYMITSQLHNKRKNLTPPPTPPEKKTT